MKPEKRKVEQGQNDRHQSSEHRSLSRTHPLTHPPALTRTRTHTGAPKKTAANL